MVKKKKKRPISLWSGVIEAGIKKKEAEDKERLKREILGDIIDLEIEIMERVDITDMMLDYKKIKKGIGFTIKRNVSGVGSLGREVVIRDLDVDEVVEDIKSGVKEDMGWYDLIVGIEDKDSLELKGYIKARLVGIDFKDKLNGIKPITATYKIEGVVEYESEDE